MKFRRPLGLLFCALAFLALPSPGRATWSIVAVDTATGEVVVASATCLANFDLQRALAVVVVQKGGAAAQSVVDQGAVNRGKIFAGLAAGLSPQAILSDLASSDSFHQQRQYGILSTDPSHGPLTFTGNGAGAAKAGVVGSVGTIRYAIQGNLLTSTQVVGAARAAFLGAAGDLGQRTMAAMEAARALGGDGRCSCSSVAPTSCGAPPPGTWKSAHTGFVVIARAGDSDGVCNGALGCANGAYYLSISAVGASTDPDPVLVLAQSYAAWRAGLLGRPDHHRSQVDPTAKRLPANGWSSALVRVRLVDVDGVPLSSGGAAVAVSAQPAGLLQHVTPVVDHGDGSYSFALSAGTVPGTVRLTVVADDGAGPVTLAPDLELHLDPPAPLHLGFDGISAQGGALVPIALDFGGSLAGAPYLVLASAGGTSPGIPLLGAVLPLVADGVLSLSLNLAGSALLPQTVGLLDSAGRAIAGFAPPPGALSGLVGLNLFWSAVAFGAPTAIAPPAGLLVLP